MVAESSLSVNDLIWPLFLIDGEGASNPIEAMPGVCRHSIDHAVAEARRARDLGIPVIALFPKTDPALKDGRGSEAINPDNLVCRAVRAIKSAVPDIGLMCDIALDPYTSHGHDGLITDGRVDNDPTLEVLRAQALCAANAGADIIAPSDMMDGRVGVIRQGLEEAGHKNVAIMAYTAKYASCFYGPFRDAVGAGADLGPAGKRSYQMDPANSDEALREAALDIAEGADMVMVKPGLPYLDIVRRLHDAFTVPVFAYQVSGEYAMIKAAAANGWLDGEAAMWESLIAFKRAGARGILTYFAPTVAAALKGE